MRHEDSSTLENDGWSDSLIVGEDLGAGGTLLDESIAALGFDALEVGAWRWELGVARPLRLLTRGLPDTLVGWYRQQRAWSADPRLERCCRAGGPFAWSVDRFLAQARLQPDASPLAWQWMRRLADAGLHGGLTLTLAQPTAPEATVVHLLARTPLPAPIAPERLARAWALATVLARLLRDTPPLADEAAARDDGATSMRERVAQCVSRGLSDKEIARRLGISRHTVDYHLRTLRSRFQVSNRVQLAQAFLSSGPGELID